MGFLSIEVASSLKLFCSHAACNGKDAALLSNLVDIQITASLFGSHITYAAFINILIRPSLVWAHFKISYVNNENGDGHRWKGMQTAGSRYSYVEEVT